MWKCEKCGILNYNENSKCQCGFLRPKNIIINPSKATRTGKRIIQFVVAPITGIVIWVFLNLIFMILVELLVGVQRADNLYPLANLLAACVGLLAAWKIVKKNKFRSSTKEIKIKNRSNLKGFGKKNTLQKNLDKKVFFDNNGNPIDTDKEKLCPDCGEVIKDIARKCRYCGYRFNQPINNDEIKKNVK